MVSLSHNLRRADFTIETTYFNMCCLLCTMMDHPSKAVAITCEGEAYPLSRACAISFIDYKRASA